MSRGCQIDWESIACCSGYKIDEIPNNLVEIFEYLHERIRDANGMSFGDKEEFGLRSTQIIGLVVMLWQMNLLNLKALRRSK